MFSWIVVPKSLTLLRVSSSAMAKVEMVGMNTMSTPLQTPGRESGTVTYQNTFQGVAPRAWAASA